MNKVIKEYNTAKKKRGNVCYGSAHGGKWFFRASDKESGAWEKIMKVRGGAEVAHKIAEVISKSWLATAGKELAAAARITPKARQQMDTLVGLRTLKDWTGETEWWHNVAGESVSMNFIHQPAVRPFAPEDLLDTSPKVVELEQPEVPALAAA